MNSTNGGFYFKCASVAKKKKRKKKKNLKRKNIENRSPDNNVYYKNKIIQYDN